LKLAEILPMKKEGFWLTAPRIAIGVLFVLLLISFFKNFDVTPKREENQQTGVKEELIYSYKNSHYAESLVNSIGLEIKPKEDEKFLCVNYSVKNVGKKDIFYVSIVDDPKVITLEQKEFSPDLSISKEPFGDLRVNESKEGFLSFRIPKDEKPRLFRIGSYSIDIKNLD